MSQHNWFRTLRRWRFPLSALLDTLFWYGAFFAAVLARLNFEIDQVNMGSLLQVATVAAATQLATGVATGLYRGRRPIASFWEVRLVVFSTLLASVTAFTVVVVVGTPNLVPLSTVFAGGAYQLLGALGVRYFARLIVEIRSRSTHTRENRTLVFGAGEAGQQISNALLKDPSTDLDPVAFLDDDKLGGTGLLGMSVLGGYQMTIDDEQGTLTLTRR